MGDWIESIAKVLPGEKIYDDALAPLAKQVGAIGGDVGKTARLILAPLQALAHFQDRLEGFFKRLAERVPEERRIEVVPEISVPAIQAMEHLDDQSELWKILEEILTKAADRDAVHLVHPAFVHIARQLAPDEIALLFAAPTRKLKAVDRLDYDRAHNKFVNRKLLSLDLGALELQSPSQFELLVIHLEKLGLLEWPVTQQVPVLGPGAVQTGITRYSEVAVTDFGKLFIAAARPPENSNA